MAVGVSSAAATAAVHGTAPGTVILLGLPQELRPLALARRRSARRKPEPIIIRTIRRPAGTIPILPAIERRFARHEFAGSAPANTASELHGTKTRRSEGQMKMKKTMLLGFAVAMATISAAKADPVPLSAYADANGFIDVQTLTCGQLANTYQEDANALSSWYSGWYNGLAHKHYMDYKKGREVEHQVIEYCKAHPDEKIIHAIGLMLKEDRAEGMMMEK